MLTIIWWWYGDVTVYIISTGQEYKANKINRKASFPQGSITSRYLGKLAQTRTTPPLFPFSERNSTWPKRAGVGGWGGGKKNRYPKGTCVRYLICVKGYEPMTIVWDTTSTPFKNKSNYAQVTNTTFFLYCFVGRQYHQAKSYLTNIFYLRMCWVPLDRLLLTLVSDYH